MPPPKKPSPPVARAVHYSFEHYRKHVRPLRNMVALRRHPKDQQAAPGSLLFRPEMKLKNSDQAEVLALGPACRQNLRVGDTVVISRFADMDRWIDGERLLLIPETDIMGVWEGSPS